MIGSLPSQLRQEHRGGRVARQQAANLLCALETVRVLIAAERGVISLEALAGDAESAANQDALLKAGVLDILIGAPLGDGAISSTAVRVKVGSSNVCSRCVTAVATASWHAPST